MNLIWDPFISRGRPATSTRGGPTMANRVAGKKLLLDGTPYVTGGWRLTPADTDGLKLTAVDILTGYDPMGRPIPDIPPVFIVPVYASTRLITHLMAKDPATGDEVDEDWVGADGSYIWLRLIGH